MKISEITNPLPLTFAAVGRPTPKQFIPPTPISDGAKRKSIIPWLTAQITRHANVPHVTKSDVAIATKRFQQNQKRVNLAHEKAQIAQRQKEERARQKLTRAQQGVQIANRGRASI